MSTTTAALIADLIFKVEELDRRLANIMRPGTITEVDHDKGLAKVNAGGLKTTWLPWLEQAGSIRSWSPPSVGQQVHVLSPSGEPGQGWIMAAGYSDANPQPHDKGAEHKLQIGAASLLVSAGKIVLTADAIELHSSSLTHNGTNISDSHVHGGVERGSADTDGPH